MPLLVTGIADMRTHIVVPEGLIAAIDARVGQRKRSRFIAEAIEEKLRRTELLEAFEAVAGSLAAADVPDWETPESTSEWVRAIRREGDRVPALWAERADEEGDSRQSSSGGAR